jgi:hypothetical protein
MTNLYALIVGIEKYDLPNWSRSGPVAGAIEMAYWCNRIGMPFKNLYMFLSINDQDAAWEKERKDQLAHFKKSGAKIVEDSKLDAIDTFWREKLPKIANGDSKLFVYWCGHGVTRPDRDRVFLHTDYNPRQLSGRVTSFNNFRATLATQAYHKFQEQLIVADVCGDFREQVSPNALPPANPVDRVTQHCYFATVDGQPTQILNGIGQFTQSTLEVLSEYHAWPNLDELKNRMDETFRNGSLNPFKISIRTSREDYDDSDDDSAKAKDAIMQPSSEDVKQLLINCIVRIKRNELDELFQLLEDFLATTKSTAFDQVRDSLLILQSDLTSFRTGEINGTLMPDTATHRRILITKVQNLLKFIESKASEQTKGSSNPKPTFKSHHDFFREQIYKLLDGNDELTAVFAQAIFSKNQTWDKKSIVDHFVVKSEKKNDFPLRRLKVVLDSLVAKRIELKQDSSQTLTLLIEIMTIASYPVGDSQTIEKAMQEILDTDTGNPTTGSLSTSKIEDAKKLLIATRIKLLGAEFSDLNIAKIFNRSITADNEVRLLLRKIHVVAAPAQKKDELTLLEFYSKAIIDDLGYEQNSKSYQDDLEDVLEQRSKVSAVISLLIPNENIEAIKQLRQRFPLLLVVELPKDSIGLYNAIFRDLKDIDECLPLLCGTVKRIT